MSCNATNTEIIAVHDELLEWAQSFSGGTHPYPSVTISGGFTSLEIGEIGIWDSETGWHDEQDGDDMTAERAIECYKRQMADLCAWPGHDKNGESR